MISGDESPNLKDECRPVFANAVRQPRMSWAAAAYSLAETNTKLVVTTNNYEKTKIMRDS
ncbi:MAG: hypothetical protein ACI9I0_002780 [Rhodoferax sp.]|jgi:hypothetical protein